MKATIIFNAHHHKVIGVRLYFRYKRKCSEIDAILAELPSNFLILPNFQNFLICTFRNIDAVPAVSACIYVLSVKSRLNPQMIFLSRVNSLIDLNIPGTNIIILFRFRSIKRKRLHLISWECSRKDDSEIS